MKTKKKKTEKQHETLSNTEKNIISVVREDISKAFTISSSQNNDFVSEIVVDAIDRFDTLFSKFLHDYDEFYLDYINKNSSKEIVENITKYLEYENLLRAFNKYIDLSIIELKSIYTEELTSGLTHDENELNESTEIFIKNSPLIKHTDILISKVSEIVSSATKKELKRALIVLATELQEAKNIMESYTNENLDKRLLNSNNVATIVKNLNDNNIININIYDSNHEMEISIAGIKFKSNKTLRISATENLNYNNTLESLNKSIEESTISAFTKLEGVNSFSNGLKFNDGRRIVVDNSVIKIDSSTITDKSYSYKELNKMAINHGYKENRCNGDHLIFTNEQGSNIVIPQRPIGRGLQLKILKDLNII